MIRVSDSGSALSFSPKSAVARAMFSVREHPPVYVPVYVTPLLSIRNPASPGSQTAMYAVALFPAHPLQVGDAVHLYLVCPPSQGPEPHPGDLRRVVAIPLEIKGRISGERERSALEVEFVVRNDEEETCVRRAFIRASADPRMSATRTPSVGRLRLRPSFLYNEQEGPLRPTRAECDLEANLGARESAHLRRQPGTDRGRWVVYTSSRTETEERRAGVPYVAPGPTREVRPAWLAPTRERRSRAPNHPTPRFRVDDVPSHCAALGLS